jgi:hypothetical protein
LKLIIDFFVYDHDHAYNLYYRLHPDLRVHDGKPEGTYTGSTITACDTLFAYGFLRTYPVDRLGLGRLLLGYGNALEQGMETFLKKLS